MYWLMQAIVRSLQPFICCGMLGVHIISWGLFARPGGKSPNQSAWRISSSHLSWRDFAADIVQL